MIYLDNASTTKVNEKVLDLYSKLSSMVFYNPSSLHKGGFESNNYVLKSSNVILKKLNLNPDEYQVIFTSGATESNNLAIKGLFKVDNLNYNSKFMGMFSPFEHSSMSRLSSYLNTIGVKTTLISLDKDGNIDYDFIKTELEKNKYKFVSVMLVNNETGKIFNLSKIRKIIDSVSKDTLLISDATQGIGKVNFDYSKLDMFSLSFHKIAGFKGAGILVKRKNISINPILLGGEQQLDLRSGTMNPPLYASSALALELAINSMEERQERAIKLKKYLIDELSNFDKNIIFNSGLDRSEYSPFILNFALPKYIKTSVVVEILSNKEIYVSTSSACSSYSSKQTGSKTLLAKGLDADLAKNSIRLSLYGYESKEEIDTFLNEFKKAYLLVKQTKDK